MLIRIPVNFDGSAGTPEVVLGPDCASLEGGGLAFDVVGNLYLATESGNRVLPITPDGVIETPASTADGLDNPHAVAFGTTEPGQKELYFTNFASMTFLAGSDPSPAL